MPELDDMIDTIFLNIFLAFTLSHIGYTIASCLYLALIYPAIINTVPLRVPVHPYLNMHLSLVIAVTCLLVSFRTLSSTAPNLSVASMYAPFCIVPVAVPWLFVRISQL